jgi:hypothetical protein
MLFPEGVELVTRIGFTWSEFVNNTSPPSKQKEKEKKATTQPVKEIKIIQHHTYLPDHASYYSITLHNYQPRQQIKIYCCCTVDSPPSLQSSSTNSNSSISAPHSAMNANIPETTTSPHCVSSLCFFTPFTVFLHFSSCVVS